MLQYLLSQVMCSDSCRYNTFVESLKTVPLCVEIIDIVLQLPML